ncbi:MAG: pyridoxal-phosphate dependent enzyme [Saprospiraceae bacterium]|nr:pyridoxal-phosphate dependent enzyme [Saprospiraceae bacterium]
MPSPLSLIPEHPGIHAGITLFLKRDDLLHPTIQGNKWRKLEPVIRLMQQEQQHGILTFGGPFSNHIHAVAAAGKAYRFPTVAIIRGLSADFSNPTMSYAHSCGMQLIPVTKQDYDAGMESAVLRQIIEPFAGYFHLPEGGATVEAIKSCAVIATEIIAQTPQAVHENRFVALPAGTGTTAAGVIGGLGRSGKAIVFPAAPHGVSERIIQSQIATVFSDDIPDFEFRTDFIFGEFASFYPELIEFVRVFLSQTGILLDPIYTAKMMWGVFEMLEHGIFPDGSVITAVHTGGLQGWDGFRQRFGVDIYQSSL